MRVTVPGNLLLCGEYAVLEPGGLGVALACAPHVTATAAPAPELALTGTAGERSFAWINGDGGLLDCVVDAVAERLGRENLPRRAVVIDSTPFWSAGHKLGFGSSAATAVAAAAALLAGEDVAPDPELVFQVALQAHRAAQGGRGSGYDVAASCFGGLGLFTGGEKPIWTPLPAPWRDRLLTLRGPSPVSTAGAVARYRAWKAAAPEQAARWRWISDRAAARFGMARNIDAALGGFRACRYPGVWIGKALGVPAEPAGLAGLLDRVRRTGAAAKASGAGGELAVALVREESYLSTIEDGAPLAVAEGGLAWVP